jgi:patatin-like phospholipase/acyl hydrolase
VSEKSQPIERYDPTIPNHQNMDDINFSHQKMDDINFSPLKMDDINFSRQKMDDIKIACGKDI